MKITGGKFRGKNIESKQQHTLRPTTSRIREVIFNLLRHGRFMNDGGFRMPAGQEDIVKDAFVLDLFCGSGALGLEAMSRDAARAVFIDREAAHIDIARKNAQQLGVEERCDFLRSDSTNLPPAAHILREETRPSLAFIDPPYNTNLVSVALENLHKQGWLQQYAVIVVEHGKQDDINPPAPYALLDERRHDKTSLSILQYGV